MTTATGQPEFYRTAPEEQQSRLADMARLALRDWGLEGAEISPAAYRENMTFRVEAGGRGVFALRIHQAGYRTDAQIKSELDLMTYLDSQGIRTPVVVPTERGDALTVVETEAVGEPRQCDLFQWIDGTPVREFGQSFNLPLEQLEAYYRDVGRLAAGIHSATERWQRPPEFDRPAWDAEGIFGKTAHLGDFRQLTDITENQQKLLLEVADKLRRELMSFGQSPDRWGLSHCDLLPENIFKSDDGYRLLDFDDAGETWYLFELTTAVFDLLETPAFDPCLEALVSGYRELHELPEAHLEMVPAFVLARALSYLGWCAKKSHMPQAAAKPVLLYMVEKQAASFLDA